MRKSDCCGWLASGSPGTVRLSKATYRSHLNREHERTILQLEETITAAAAATAAATRARARVCGRCGW